MRTSTTTNGGGAHPRHYRNNRILIVDDQPELHDDFREILAPSAEPRESDDLAAAFGNGDGWPNAAADRDDAFLPPFEIRHAYCGLEACAQVEKAWSEGRPFAMAFVDLRMPGIDGIEAIRRIRRTDRDLEIVVMTAYSKHRLGNIVRDTELLHKMLYVHKPFIREEIQQIALCMVGRWNADRARRTA